MKKDTLRSIPTIDFQEDLNSTNLNSNIVYTIIAIIFSLAAGIYAGLKSGSIFDALIFTFMFFGEGIMSITAAKFLSLFSLQKSAHRFAIFFCIMGLSCTLTALIMKVK